MALALGRLRRSKQPRLKYGRAQGFETNANGFALAGPKYYTRFRAVCIEMMKKYGVNYFKFDGVGGGNTEPGRLYAAQSGRPPTLKPCCG